MRDTALPSAYPLCPIGDIPEGEAKGFCVRREGQPMREIFVARLGSRVFGYANSCPHTGSPLDWAPDQFMDPNGEHIMCATHGALFRIADGYCLAGPCAGDHLSAVELAVIDGIVAVTEP